MVDSLKHSAILASAGSGKTYTLTNRFIYLLHQFKQPERIIVLTFTRTAAGEFFQKIVEKLCTAAESDTHAASLSRELSINADCDSYRYLLKLLVQSMHQLNLQTLDSFFFRVVSAFSLELGLSENLELLDEMGAVRIRNITRDEIVHRPGATARELKEFWHAFKQATYGMNSRSIEKVVSQYIEHLYEYYLDRPEVDCWGQVNTIWPRGCIWKSDSSPDWDRLASNLLAVVPDNLTKAQTNAFDTAAECIRNYGKDEKTNALLNKAFSVAPDIFAGRASIKIYKDIELGRPLCQALGDCLKIIVWHHLHRSLNNTQGVYRILQAYHRYYDQTVRRNGQLTFADLTHLLSPESQNSPMHHVDQATRQLMDFRLDGHFDHWLFDEFQDTSRSQWKVVANLIDEVVQDNSGERSFFYVGDTKQCLYLWRNSDDRLFHDIRKQYNYGGYERIEQKPLSTSWRSALPIIDAVNTVFGDQSALAETFSADAVARWKRSWQVHEVSPATESLSGFACWLKVQKDESPTRNELILQLLNDLNPIERGLSVGILVRKNANANEIADYLRENCQLPVHNGSAVKPASDNAAGVALLALLQLAAHPRDMLARGYLQLIDESTQGPGLVHSAVFLRERLFSESCESALRWAAEQITAHLNEEDDWHRERLQQLIDQARAFDSEPVLNIDNLIQFLKASSSGDSKSEKAVVVETIHKSKGLEYDVVLYINEDKYSRAETAITPFQDEQGNTRWLLQPIRKEFMQVDPELKQLLTQTTSQRDFGNLCALYVAMTRAKRGLYMISDLERAHQTSPVHFLKQVLGSESQAEPETGDFKFQKTYPTIWSTGDSEWYEAFEPKVAEPVQRIVSETNTFAPAHPRLQLSRPSAQESWQISAAIYFDLEQTAANFGTQVHDVFEQIKWYTGLPPILDESVEQTLRSCFAQPEIRELFTQPSGQTTVWRERAFSYVEDDQFVNGIFDRVVLYRNENGAISHAEIIDFKTDRIHADKTIEQATEHHRPQLEVYRKALARIVGVKKTAITLKLLFTNVPQLVIL